MLVVKWLDWVLREAAVYRSDNWTYTLTEEVTDALWELWLVNWLAGQAPLTYNCGHLPRLCRWDSTANTQAGCNKYVLKASNHGWSWLEVVYGILFSIPARYIISRYRTMDRAEEPMPHKSMDLPSESGDSGAGFGVPLTEAEMDLVEQLKEEVKPIVQADYALQLFCNEHTYVRYLRARWAGRVRLCVGKPLQSGGGWIPEGVLCLPWTRYHSSSQRYLLTLCWRSWDLKKATKMLTATLEWWVECTHCIMELRGWASSWVVICQVTMDYLCLRVIKAFASALSHFIMNPGLHLLLVLVTYGQLGRWSSERALLVGHCLVGILEAQILSLERVLS